MLSGKKFILKAISIIALAAMIFLPACTAYRRPGGTNEKYQYDVESLPNHTEQPTPKRDLELTGAIPMAVNKVSASVVGISTTFIQQDQFMGGQEVQGVGSGVIVSPDGFVLTNNHVAGANATSIVVILHNGDELEGQVLWSDPTLDLAMVKVNAVNLPAAKIGDSEQLVVGEPAIAIGTPLGLQFQHTVTRGIISALDRTVQVPSSRGENFMEDLIQTDASINPGNSGGPLINIEGQVIGINTVKVESAEGIGFAIPIAVAKPIIQHFIEDGSYITPYIGIVGFDKAMASYFTKNDSLEDGVYVVDVDPKGPAYKSGIRADDIITNIDSHRVTKMLELRRAIYTKHVGQTVKVTAIRQGQQMEFNMTLEESPVNSAS